MGLLKKIGIGAGVVVGASLFGILEMTGEVMYANQLRQGQRTSSRPSTDYVSTQAVERPIAEMPASSENPLLEKIREAYKIMAREDGEDGITLKDKLAFLKRIEISEVIDEVEQISLSVNKEDPKSIDVYFNAPNRNRAIVPDKPLGYVKNISAEAFSKYMASTPPKKK